MLDVVIRAGSFVAIIVLSYGLKRIGFFKQEDFTLLAKICLRITLPATIIVSFAGKQIDASLLVLSLFSILCGITYLTVGFLMERKNGREQQSFTMLNLAGYNIGTFVIPFVQSFLGPLGVIATSLFDVGNSVISLGGAFSIASMVKDGGKFSVKRILRTLSRSVAFVCYISMLMLNLLGISLPGPVISCAQVIANANAFMAMMIIGVGFKLSGKPSQYKTIAKIVLTRYSIGTAFALVFYFLTPFAVEVRQALVILALSPIGSAVPGFTEEMKSDVGLSSAINSICIVISIVITIVLLSIML